MPPNITEDQFWSRFRPSYDCFEWTMATDRKGYGIIQWRRRAVHTHRLAWELTVGPIPAGLSVCHLCDNRLCARADGPTYFDEQGRLHKGHLWLGTNADNTYDMIAKGRAILSHPRPGILSPQAKLTEAQVRMIRHLRATTTMTLWQIARQFGIRDTTVVKIVKGQRWGHLGGVETS